MARPYRTVDMEERSSTVQVARSSLKREVTACDLGGVIQVRMVTDG